MGISDAPFRWGGLRWWWHRRVRCNIPPFWYVVFAVWVLLMRGHGAHVPGYEERIAWWPYPHVKMRRPDAAYVAVERERMSTIKL